MARRTVEIMAECRIRSRLLSVELTDISAGGCRIRSPNMHVGLGQRVKLKIYGLELVAGTVRWRDPEHAGVEFDTPLDQAVIEHICNAPQLRKKRHLQSDS